MKLIILFTFIAVFSAASGQSTQMPPTVIRHMQLPICIEGYTVNITSSGNMRLYDNHSNESARNIYNNGGIRIEIESLRRIPNFKPGQSAQEQLHNFRNYLRVSQQGLVKGKLYELTLKVSPGDDFDNRRRRPNSLQGSTSQVVMHWPEQVKLVSDPVIKIDGITQAQQMFSNLLNIASIGLTPGAGHMAVSLKKFIFKVIDKTISDNVVNAAFSPYRPSEIFEIYDGINFGTSRNLQQLTWVLGGHRGRDIATAKSAEISFFISFEETGDFDLSFFFNIWGTHSYTPPSAVTMGLKDIVLHSFRQHVVLKIRVVD